MIKSLTWDDVGIVDSNAVVPDYKNYLILRNLFQGATILDVEFDSQDCPDGESHQDSFSLLLSSLNKNLISLTCTCHLAKDESLVVEFGEVEKMS